LYFFDKGYYHFDSIKRIFRKHFYNHIKKSIERRSFINKILFYLIYSFYNQSYNKKNIKINYFFNRFFKKRLLLFIKQFNVIPKTINQININLPLKIIKKKKNFLINLNSKLFYSKNLINNNYFFNDFEDNVVNNYGNFKIQKNQLFLNRKIWLGKKLIKIKSYYIKNFNDNFIKYICNFIINKFNLFFQKLQLVSGWIDNSIKLDGIHLNLKQNSKSFSLNNIFLKLNLIIVPKLLVEKLTFNYLNLFVISINKFFIKLNQLKSFLKIKSIFMVNFFKLFNYQILNKFFKIFKNYSTKTKNIYKKKKLYKYKKSKFKVFYRVNIKFIEKLFKNNLMYNYSLTNNFLNNFYKLQILNNENYLLFLEKIYVRMLNLKGFKNLSTYLYYYFSRVKQLKRPIKKTVIKLSLKKNNVNLFFFKLKLIFIKLKKLRWKKLYFIKKFKIKFIKLKKFNNIIKNNYLNFFIKNLLTYIKILFFNFFKLTNTIFYFTTKYTNLKLILNKKILVYMNSLKFLILFYINLKFIFNRQNLKQKNIFLNLIILVIKYIKHLFFLYNKNLIYLNFLKKKQQLNFIIKNYKKKKKFNLQFRKTVQQKNSYFKVLYLLIQNNKFNFNFPLIEYFFFKKTDLLFWFYLLFYKYWLKFNNSLKKKIPKSKKYYRKLKYNKYTKYFKRKSSIKQYFKNNYYYKKKNNLLQLSNINLILTKINTQVSNFKKGFSIKVSHQSLNFPSFYVFFNRLQLIYNNLLLGIISKILKKNKQKKKNNLKKKWFKNRNKYWRWKSSRIRSKLNKKRYKYLTLLKNNFFGLYIKNFKDSKKLRYHLFINQFNKFSLVNFWIKNYKNKSIQKRFLKGYKKFIKQKGKKLFKKNLAFNIWKRPYLYRNRNKIKYTFLQKHTLIKFLFTNKYYNYFNKLFYKLKFTKFRYKSKLKKIYKNFKFFIKTYLYTLIYILNVYNKYFFNNKNFKKIFYLIWKIWSSYLKKKKLLQNFYFRSQHIAKNKNFYIKSIYQKSRSNKYIYNKFYLLKPDFEKKKNFDFSKKLKKSFFNIKWAKKNSLLTKSLGKHQLINYLNRWKLSFLTFNKQNIKLQNKLFYTIFFSFILLKYKKKRNLLNNWKLNKILFSSKAKWIHLKFKILKLKNNMRSPAFPLNSSRKIKWSKFIRSYYKSVILHIKATGRIYRKYKKNTLKRISKLGFILKYFKYCFKLFKSTYTKIQLNYKNFNINFKIKLKKLIYIKSVSIKEFFFNLYNYKFFNIINFFTLNFFKNYFSITKKLYFSKFSIKSIIILYFIFKKFLFFYLTRNSNFLLKKDIFFNNFTQLNITEDYKNIKQPKYKLIKDGKLKYFLDNYFFIINYKNYQNNFFLLFNKFLLLTSNKKKIIYLKNFYQYFYKFYFLNIFYINKKFNYFYIKKKIYNLKLYILYFFLNKTLFFLVSRSRNFMQFKIFKTKIRFWLKNKKFYFWLKIELEKLLKVFLKLKYNNAIKSLNKSIRLNHNKNFLLVPLVYHNRKFSGWRQQTIFSDILWTFLISVKYSCSSAMSDMISEQISKRQKHWGFIRRLKACLNDILPETKLYESPISLDGLRISINGKINGKDRAIAYLFYKFYKDKQISKLYWIDLKVDYSLTYVFSWYGSFGIKVWISKI
jgi:hypothetical protein